MDQTQRQLVICLPCYDGTLQYGCMAGIVQLTKLCETANIGVQVMYIARDSLITRARNYLCKGFLDILNATHMLFVDSDIEFQAEDVMRMLEANVDIIGGIYPKKSLRWEKGKDYPIMDYVVSNLSSNDVITDINQPFEVRYVGTGLMLIKRGVLHAMMSAFPDDWYYEETTKYHKFFDCQIVDNNYLSEDYYFCERWRRLGGKVYAAYWTRTVHWGIHGFEGDVIAYALKVAANS
jgi:hypothetical protein